MTRIGLKWRGGTPKPEPGDKGFSDVWWISQEVDQDRNIQLRQETIAKLLEDANRHDSCGMSESAIREARSAMTIKPRKKSTNRTSARRPKSQSQLGLRSAGRGRELSTQRQEEADDNALNEAGVMQDDKRAQASPYNCAMIPGTKGPLRARYRACMPSQCVLTV